MHYFSNLFWYGTLNVSDSNSVHHQQSNNVYTAIGICHTGYVDCVLAISGWNNACVNRWKKTKLERPIEIAIIVRPNCLNVDKAIILFKSHSKFGPGPAINIVNP